MYYSQGSIHKIRDHLQEKIVLFYFDEAAQGRRTFSRTLTVFPQDNSSWYLPWSVLPNQIP